MSYAGGLLTGVLQPYLLGTAGNSPAYGRNIVTAVRSSSQGSMLMIVNGNDWSRTVNVDLRSYPHNQGGIRYLVQSTGVSSMRLSATVRQQSITLGAGQTVVYIMNNVNGPANRANSLF